MSSYNVRLTDMEYINITSCEVYKQINEHGYTKISGYFGSNYVDTISRAAETEKWVALMAKSDQQQERIIYSGRITQCDISCINGYHEVSMVIVSDTFFMDLEKKTRVYQNLSETYESIINDVGSGAGARHISNADLGIPINGMKVQYNETDWEFIKRLVSEKKSFLIPIYDKSGCNFYIGLPRGKSFNFTSHSYHKIIDYQSYQEKKGKGLDTDLYNEISYSIRCRDNLELGDGVNLAGISATLYVYQVKSKLEGSHMMHEYLLKTEAGFKMPRIINYNIVGASISGVVKAVKNDKVKVNMDLNGHQDNGKWFEFATVYSSSNGAGWYCMPEIGDKVRVYFPDSNEDHSYVFNANHISMGDKNPEIKFLRNPQGKEIIFAPTYIKISNNNGMYILLDDKEGISIQSNKAFYIRSKDRIEMLSLGEKVGIYSLDKIELKQGNSSVIVDQDVILNGKQVHVQ